MLDIEKMMPDIDKVIRGLECCKNKTCDYAKPDVECPYIDWVGEYETSCYECTKRLADDALALLKAQEPGWISVKDRLPESAGLKVLVAAKSDESVIQTMAVFTAFLGYGDWKWYTQDVGFMKNAKLHDNEIHPCWTITHWMLPPEPPKEE